MKKPTIPKQLSELYRQNGRYSHLYATLRWRYCPYEQMESFLPKKGNVFDFGCGEGLFTNYLAVSSPSRTVFGVDADPIRVERARKASGGSLPNVAFKHGDVGTIEFPKEGIHGSSFCDFLHHIPTEAQNVLLRRVAKHTAPGGVLLIKEVAKDNRTLSNWWARFLDFVLYPKDKIYYRSSAQWLDQLKELGFEAKAIDTDVQTFIPNRVYIGVKK